MNEWGGDPEYTSFGILCSTICHNEPGIGSRKLYFYDNSNLFRCYTGCDCYFDIFELVIKIAHIQWNKEYTLYNAVWWIANRFGFNLEYKQDDPEEQLDDWQYLKQYDRIQDIELKQHNICLKEYDPTILSRFNYDVKIQPWIDEDISEDVMKKCKIGFYPGKEQITIPHFDVNNRFIGLRGRFLSEDKCDRYGKYRPIKIQDLLYTHPLGMNLYNLNNSKNAIKIVKKAIIFEGEKSCLKYRSYFGDENDISVACCGSSISSYQIQLLLDAGAQEIIIAFDRQFQEIGDTEFQHLKNNLIRTKDHYKTYAMISFIFDKNMITGYKASPIDEGKDKFLTLFNERIV